MLSKSTGSLRLTFLGKFALTTFALAFVVANILSYFLIHSHDAAIEANEAASAAGQISALLTKPLATYSTTSGPMPPRTIRGIAAVEAEAKRFQYVLGMRLYKHDGTPLYPAGASRADDDVRHTLQIGDLWSENAPPPHAREVRTEYLPFVTSKSVFVVAIDLSRSEMLGQSAGEARTVRIATAGAIALIFISLLALVGGASREIERRRREAQSTLIGTLSILADVIDKRDHYTAGHSKRVAVYSRLLANELRLSPQECDTVERAALLHDLGKIGIPDAVLLKPAGLTDAERLIIGTHPSIGAEIIRTCGAMDDVVPCVLHHHERIDGRGYPDKLRDDAIPRGARAIAVCDSFDAMTTDRPYRKALSVATALLELNRVAGTQLDRTHVNAFERVVAALLANPSATNARYKGELGHLFTLSDPAVPPTAAREHEAVGATA